MHKYYHPPCPVAFFSFCMYVCGCERASVNSTHQLVVLTRWSTGQVPNQILSPFTLTDPEQTVPIVPTHSGFLYFRSTRLSRRSVIQQTWMPTNQEKPRCRWSYRHLDTAPIHSVPRIMSPSPQILFSSSTCYSLSDVECSDLTAAMPWDGSENQQWKIACSLLR